MAEDYSKYIFSNFNTVDKILGYTFPHFDGKIQAYVFDRFWHKSEEIGLWGEVNLHYKAGAMHGGGAAGFATQDGLSVTGEEVKKGDVLFRMGVHYHTVPELFFFFGTDPKKPGMLGGEYIFYTGLGEEAVGHTFETNTVIYMPPGVYHNPNGALRVDDPEHPIGHAVMLCAPGHWGNISDYAVDENGGMIFPPDFTPTVETDQALGHQQSTVKKEGDE